MSGSGMHANTGKANEAEPFTPLSSMEEREAYYRHKFLADAEKALRPTNPDIPEDTEIADVKPISVRYHLRSNLDLFNQYGTNIDRMPRTKHTSYQPETATEKDYCQHGKRFYRLPDGYKLRLPNEGQTALDCPPGHIVVYAKYFELGLRFPLHHYIEKIFRAWNVSIAQLTPPTIRNIVSLVWVMIFMDFPLTLNLFRRLHWIKRDSQSPGWWSHFTAPGKCTVWPKLTSCKNWKKEFYFMSVPDDFTVRRTFYHPHNMFETIRSRALGKLEKKAFKWFNCTYVSAGKKNKVVPGVWLPHCNYILGNAPLSHVGLCHTDEFGMEGL
uniref:Transposase (putative) gypsy type domain-containing protein n=1 Tax=Chenopodium quinoa TaxID=63459 RepID=A0A803LJD3_CHEQI